MKKFILSTIIGLGIAFSSIAQDLPEVTKESIFNAKELSLTLGTGYSGVESSFSDQYDFNLEGGVDYFLTKNIGLNASLPFYFKNGFRLEEVSAGVTLRVPVRYVAPYIGANIVYNWEADQTQYLGRAGLEARLNKGWGVFGEARYRINSFNSSDVENGDWSIVGGVRLVLF